MSAHNLSHADIYSAGNGVFNNKADQPNQPRGLPVIPLGWQHFGTVATLDADGVATSQTPSAGGQQDLTLDGAFATGGVATMPNNARSAQITAVGNETARTFTFIGTDVNGDPQREEIAGPNASTVETGRDWETITRIFVDDDTAAAVSVGDGTTIGLRTRGGIDPTGNANTVAMVFEDGQLVTTGTFTAGDTTSPPIATTPSSRLRFTPGSFDVDITILWFPDLTKEGKGENFTG